MLPATVLVSLCVVALSGSGTADIPRYYIKIKNIECEASSEWAVNVSCRLKPISWERTVANMAADIVKPLTNLSVNGQIYRREARYLPFLVNITRNVCEVFNNKGVNFYSKVAVVLLKQFTNLILTCPITIGHWEAKDLYFDIKYIPLMAPTGVYQAAFTFTECCPPRSVGYFKIHVQYAEKTKV